MKNTMKTIICLIMVVGVIICFSACGTNEKTDATNAPVVKQYVTGRYELENIEYENGTISSGEVLKQAEDVMGDMYVELFNDGTAQLSLFGQIKDMEFSDDKMWQIDMSSVSYEFSVKNGKVTLEKDGDTYIFVKK